MIKVGHIVTKYGSAVTILRSKLAALDAFDDLDVTVITGPPPPSLDLPAPPVRHLVAPLTRPIQPLTDAACARRLRDLIRSERFDVIHTHASKAGVLGAIAARLAGVRLIVHTFHGLAHYEAQSRRRFMLYRTIEYAACRLRHHALSQNKGDMPEIARLMGSPDKVTYEGNGVDVADVRTRAEQHRPQGQAAFPPGDVRLALVSRLEPVKRIADFIGACADLNDHGVAVSAAIAGQGPLEAPLRETIGRFKLEDRIRLLGWSPFVPSLLEAADVVVLTSEKEGLPRSLMEAMALGKPVVATYVPGTRELVIDGQTGFLTPLGDTRALAERIAQLAADKSLRRRFGQAGATRIEAHFNDLTIAAFLREFYLEHLSG